MNQLESFPITQILLFGLKKALVFWDWEKEAGFTTLHPNTLKRVKEKGTFKEKSTQIWVYTLEGLEYYWINGVLVYDRAKNGVAAKVVLLVTTGPTEQVLEFKDGTSVTLPLNISVKANDIVKAYPNFDHPLEIRINDRTVVAPGLPAKAQSPQTSTVKFSYGSLMQLLGNSMDIYLIENGREIKVDPVETDLLLEMTVVKGLEPKSSETEAVMSTTEIELMKAVRTKAGFGEFSRVRTTVRSPCGTHATVEVPAGDFNTFLRFERK